MKFLTLFFLASIFLISFSSAVVVEYTVFNATIEDDLTKTITTNQVGGITVRGYPCLISGCSEVGGKISSMSSYSSSNQIDVSFPENNITDYGYVLYFSKDGYFGWEESNVFAWGNGFYENPNPVYLSKKRNGTAEIENFVAPNSANISQIVSFSADIVSPIDRNTVSNFSLNEGVEVKVIFTIENFSNIVYQENKILNIPYSGTEAVNFNYTFLKNGTFDVSIQTEISDEKFLSFFEDIEMKTIVISSLINQSNNNDTTPPILNLPSTITVNATNLSGVNVNFNVTATDDVDPNPIVSCSQLSGSLFKVGTTTVSCNATDFSDNVATGSFNVVVNYPSNDTTVPVITVHSPKNKEYSNNDILINVSLNENGSCFYNLDDGANKTFTKSGNFFWSYENNLADGQYTLNIFCKDLNLNGATESVDFSIDTSNNNKKKKKSSRNCNDGVLEDDFVVGTSNFTEFHTQVLNSSERKTLFPFWIILLLLGSILLILLIILMIVISNKKE